MSDDTGAVGPTDDERMQAAVDLARAQQSPTAESILEHHKVNMTGRVIAVLVIAAVIGGLIGFVLGSGSADNTDSYPIPTWRLVLGSILFAGGLVGCAVMLLRMVRVGAFRRGRSKPLQVLTAGQRKSVLDQVRGKEAVVIGQLPVTRLFATNMLVVQANSWSSASLVAVLAGIAVRSDDAGPWYVVAFVTVLMVVGEVSGRALMGRARAFLDANPAPPADPAPV